VVERIFFDLIEIVACLGMVRSPGVAASPFGIKLGTNAESFPTAARVKP
jgi:hypothetical protein